MLDKRNLRVVAPEEKQTAKAIRVSDQQLFQDMGVTVGSA